MASRTPTMQSMFGAEASGGFFDLPMAKPGKVDHADIVLMGISCATPYTSVGPCCADAPDAIRAAFGWPGVLNHHDFDIDGYLLADNVRAIDWGVSFYPMREVVRNGIDEIIEKIPVNQNLYIHLISM